MNVLKKNKFKKEGLQVWVGVFKKKQIKFEREKAVGVQGLIVGLRLGLLRGAWVWACGPGLGF